jgi:hypothetical protein
VVEAKLCELERAVKAGFDPNQPRVAVQMAGSGRVAAEAVDRVLDRQLQAAQLLRRLSL